jgi:GINS complex subunit 2
MKLALYLYNIYFNLKGKFGPFRPNKPVKVPLWVAMQLKKSKSCRISPPIWMSLQTLQIKLEMEKITPESLQDLDYYFYEISNILFNKAEDDISESKPLRSIIEDISSLRSMKIKNLIESIKDSQLHLNLANICARELEQIRPFLSENFNTRLEIKRLPKYGEWEGNNERVEENPSSFI